MAINKIMNDFETAVAGVKDGSTILVSGFGGAGMPTELLNALRDQGATDLTIVSNNAGVGREGIGGLLSEGKVKKVICSYPRSGGSVIFEEMWAAGKVELEVVPQGTLSERIRAAGAGIGAFYTPTGVGTQLAEGKEVRKINGRDQVLEYPLKGDVAFVLAKAADRWGNLIYNKSARNFGPVMAPAADLTVVQVHEIVELGALDPEAIVTPSIFVDRVVKMAGPGLGESV
ncbi:MAG: 3-oxoacid CoA-transferase subunit A [Thalassobaculaceae bacterium]|jgi:3-oxoadipate CoA-transferase alpha subunit|nr:3-oxoacid CoA-transferase subunit A [Alphaproteobacteria bacterium]|tara:strand:+ start:182 stop:871 length:690 start_codon:yes stop_codon:yes gene_type:complete